jgi:hypothetical protein
VDLLHPGELLYRTIANQLQGRTNVGEGRHAPGPARHSRRLGRTIRTGADRGRVPAAFEPVLAGAVACVGGSGAPLYVYGVGR